MDVGDPRQAAHLLMVGSRVAGAMLLAPVFGSSVVPLPLRIVVAALLGWVLAMGVPPLAGAPAPESAMGMAGVMAAELAVGALLGWTASLILLGAQTGGQLIDQELSFLNVRPEGDEGPTLFATFKFLLAGVVFLSVNGHHLLLSALHESFFVWRPGGGGPGPEGALSFAAGSLGAVFGIGLAIAAPVLLAGLLVNLGVGLLGRAFPASNLAVVALGGRALALLLVLAATLGGIVVLLQDSIGAGAARWAEGVR